MHPRSLQALPGFSFIALIPSLNSTHKLPILQAHSLFPPILSLWLAPTVCAAC